MDLESLLGNNDPSAGPVSPVKGQIRYTNQNTLQVYTGSRWIEMRNGAFDIEQPDPSPLDLPEFGNLFDSVFLGSDGMFGGDS